MPSANRQAGNPTGAQILLLVTLFTSTFSGYLYWLSSNSEIDDLIEQYSAEKGAGDFAAPLEFTFPEYLLNVKYVGVKDDAAVTKVSSLPSKRSPDMSSSENFFIQAGAFNKRSNADQAKAELTLLGIDQIEIQASRSTGVSMYRTLIGPLHSYSLAAKKVSFLESQGYPSIVLKKNNP